MKEINPDAPGTDEILDSILQAQSTAAITLLRIYDVLISHYGEVNEKDARDLAELHKNGGIRAPLPWLQF